MHEWKQNENTLIYCLRRVFEQGKVMKKFCQARLSGLQSIKQRCHQRGTESFFSKNYRLWNEARHKNHHLVSDKNAWHAVRGFCCCDISLDTCSLRSLKELNKDKTDRGRVQWGILQINTYLFFSWMFGCLSRLHTASYSHLYDSGLLMKAKAYQAQQAPRAISS